MLKRTLPEYDVRVSVLGHMVVLPCFDNLASRLGVKAVKLLEGKSNYMVGLQNDK
jgi:6-phosphofructokinase